MTTSAAIDNASNAALNAIAAIEALADALDALASIARDATLNADDAAAIGWSPQLVKNVEDALIGARRNANLCRIHAA